jgi:hypothetical protein
MRKTRLALLFLTVAGCAGGGAGPRPPLGTGGEGEPPAPEETPRPKPMVDAAVPADAVAVDAAWSTPSPDGPGPADTAVADAAPGPDATAGPPPLGARFSLEPNIAGRWTGTRRTITMDGASKVFTAGFEAGKFGAGGNGHLIRMPIAPGREYVFEYRLRFDPGWDFSRGGKIPGLAGGNAPSGCQTSTGVGFTARQMWRQQGRLIGYIYDMDQSGDCGNAIETGFNFAVGKWYQVKQRIKLNTGSNHDGILQLWIDDRQVINRSNMGWMVEAPTRRIDKIFLDFFFGGSTADWSPSRDCSLSFSDLYITRVVD